MNHWDYSYMYLGLLGALCMLNPHSSFTHSFPAVIDLVLSKHVPSESHHGVNSEL